MGVEDDKELAAIRAVKRVHEPRWLALSGVVAVGIGRLADGRNGIILSVKGQSDPVRMQVPTQVEGVSIEIHETGTLQAKPLA